MPLLAVLVPAGAAVLIAASRRRPNLRETWTLAAAVGNVAVVVSMLPRVLDGETPEVTLLTIVRGVELTLRADATGMIFALSATVLWVLTSVYSIGYVRGLDERHQTRYYASFALCIAATGGLAFSANLVTFFVFYELLTVATYPLVAHKGSPEALAAGRRYLAYLLAGGAALLLAVAIVESVAPGADFTAGGFLDGALSDAGMVALAALFLVGFGTKAAVMPLHAWLPTAMIAPTPVSALLHAVAVVKAGVFGFARAFGFVIGPETLREVGAGAVIAALAAATIVLASVLAFRQDNLKRRLAYSTIAHLSYIVLGLTLVSAAAWDGALLHIVNHGALKITLFFCAGAIYVRTGVDKVSDLDGIGRQMPITMAAFGVAALGLAGVPPVGGWVSKWFLSLGAIEAEEPLLAVVVIGSGLLTAGYLMPIVTRAFLRTSDRFPARGEASAFMVAPLALTALAGLVLGVSDLFRIDALTSLVSPLVTGVGLGTPVLGVG